MPRLLACLVLLAACSRPAADPKADQAESPAPPEPPVPEDSPEPPVPEDSPGPRPGSFHDETVPEQPEARQLCDALHLLPAGRRAACCLAADSKPAAPGAASPVDPAAQGQADACTMLLSAAVAAGGVVLDDDGIAACTAAISAELADCSWVGPTPPPRPVACAAAVHGTLPAESRCKSSLECAPGLGCTGLGDAGTCTAAPATSPDPRDILAHHLRVDPGPPRAPTGSRCTQDAECRGACLQAASGKRTCGPRCEPG